MQFSNAFQKAREHVMTMDAVSTGLFLVLSIWLTATSVPGSVFATWTDTVVLDGGTTRNASMTQSIAAVNASLSGTCRGDHMSLPDVRFSLHASMMRGSVFCTTNPTTYDSKLLLCLVLWMSFAFQLQRVAYSTDSLDYTHVAPNESSGNLMTDNIYRPDFLRWLEYTVTSPLQIIVICSTVYMRNAQQLLLISALQGGLTLCGFALELCICHLEISSVESVKHSRGFSQMTMKMLAVFAGAVYIHCVI